jgi:hypothetical protein
MADPGRTLRLVVVGALALAGCDSIDQGKLQCEEAMAGVLACCPGLAQSPVVCEYVQTTPVTWLFPNVDCLVGLSCAELTARGVCAWAQAPGASAVCP